MNAAIRQGIMWPPLAFRFGMTHVHMNPVLYAALSRLSVVPAPDDGLRVGLGVRPSR
jgi:hypothetical protein